MSKILINTLDTVVEGGGVICRQSSPPLAVLYLLPATGEYCIWLML